MRRRDFWAECCKYMLYWCQRFIAVAGPHLVKMLQLLIILSWWSCQAVRLAWMLAVATCGLAVPCSNVHDHLPRRWKMMTWSLLRTGYRLMSPPVRLRIQYFGLRKWRYSIPIHPTKWKKLVYLREFIYQRFHWPEFELFVPVMTGEREEFICLECPSRIVSSIFPRIGWLVAGVCKRDRMKSRPLSAGTGVHCSAESSGLPS